MRQRRDAGPGAERRTRRAAPLSPVRAAPAASLPDRGCWVTVLRPPYLSPRCLPPVQPPTRTQVRTVCVCGSYLCARVRVCACVHPCVYLILRLDVCPLSDQRFDDRQMSISTCHVQWRIPVLPAQPPQRMRESGLGRPGRRPRPPGQPRRFLLSFATRLPHTTVCAVQSLESVGFECL